MIIDFRPRFSFNSHEYDFWEIYQAIKTYYPIGIPKGEGQGIYFEYPGIKKMEEIIMDNVHDKNNYKTRWTDYTKVLGKSLGKEILGTTFGQAPSFSASVILEKNHFGSCFHLKELSFAISHIGNFYSIYGIDSTTITDKEGEFTKYYKAANVVTTSPYKEFKQDFESLEKSIQERYPNHRLVPYAFGQQIVDGLRVRYSDAEVCSVHMALFNDFVQPRNNALFTQGMVVEHTRGDLYYGMEAWRKD